MAFLSYLPSARFVLIVVSIAVSGGLVVAAQKITSPGGGASSITSSSASRGVPTGDWLANLRAIEGEHVGKVSTSTSGELAQGLRSAAQSTNLTDTVARTLFINLSEAKSQGLGSDIPTQEKLIEQAVAQIKKDRAPTYTLESLRLTDNNTAALKKYGNAVIEIIAAHPGASFVDAVYAVGRATDNTTPAELAPLASIQKEYRALAEALRLLPVPPTLAPLHLQMVNNLAGMADALGDVAVLFNDSLRGLAGFELYQALNNETTRVFINIGQVFVQNGILFNKDEAGAAWGSFLSAQ